MTVSSGILVLVDGLKAASGLDELTRAIQRLDPTALVQVDVDQGLVDVVTVQPHQAVLMAIREQGYGIIS